MIEKQQCVHHLRFRLKMLRKSRKCKELEQIYLKPYKQYNGVYDHYATVHVHVQWFLFLQRKYIVLAVVHFVNIFPFVHLHSGDCGARRLIINYNLTVLVKLFHTIVRYI